MLPVLVVSIAMVSSFIFVGCCWCLKRKRKGKQKFIPSKYYKFLSESNRHFMLFVGSSKEKKEDDSKTHHDLPFYDIKSLVAATENFSVANKLGEGGFGSVYKVSQYST